MSRICTLSGVVGASLAPPQRWLPWGVPPSMGVPTAHRCMGLPPLHGVARRVSRQKEKLHREVTQ